MNSSAHVSVSRSGRPLSSAIAKDPLLLQWMFALARLSAEERKGMLSRGPRVLAERLERPDLAEDLGALASAPVFDEILEEVSAALAG